jgi:hypothetical protein
VGNVPLHLNGHPVAAYFFGPKSFTRLARGMAAGLFGRCTGTAAGLLARAGRRRPRASSYRCQLGDQGAIVGLAVTCNAMRRRRLGRRDRSGAEPPGRLRPSPRQPAARTSFAPGGAPSRRESTLTAGGFGGGGARGRQQGAVLVGGPGGCVTRHLLPWREAESAPRRLVPERSSSTLAGQDHRRIVPSGLNEPQFPVFSRKT